MAIAPLLPGEETPRKVPQAVAALEHLQAKPNAGLVAWTAGSYRYDGAGNIKGIGSEAFVYDKVGRLKSATVRGPDLTSFQTQTFSYDVYGNLIGTSKLGQTVSSSAGESTNRLTGSSYDAAGNLLAAGAAHFGYDALGMLNTIHIGTNSQPRMVYAYTADDERLFSFDVATGTTHWTLRGLDNKVLRDFKQAGGAWSVERDYVYRNGLLLASLKAGGMVEHYTLDHLGTPRLVTDAAGHKIGYHAYWPFGEEWTPGNGQEGNPLKYAGHERDADQSGGAPPLDYMHARYYDAMLGHFCSVDPLIDIKSALVNPGMWNRYAYVANSPMRSIDPDGRLVRIDGSAADQKVMLEMVRQNLAPKDRHLVTLGKNGLLQVAANARGSTIAFAMLKSAIRNTNQTIGIAFAEKAITKAGPGLSRVGVVDLQEAGGGATTGASRSLSGEIEVRIDPRANRSGQSLDLVLGHELIGHAIDLMLRGTSSEHSARNTENLIRLSLGLPQRANQIVGPWPDDPEH